MTTIGINAHLLSKTAGYRQAGIHTYIAESLRHLPPDPTLNYTLFCGDPPDFLRTDDRFQLQASRWDTQHPLRRIAWEQLVLPVAARRAQIDILHGMAFVTPVASCLPTIVTVFDLSFVHYPHTFPTPQRLYLQTQTARSCRQAAHVITISAASRQDVIELYALDPQRVSVIYPGVDPRFAPALPEAVADFRVRHQLPKRFILHLGTLQPRKNIPVLLQALAALGENAPPLMLVGGKGWMYAEIFALAEQLGLSDRVRFVGFAEAGELPLWYNAASVVVVPSLYEGFGMPLVEAQACGTPVIAADISALPEAVGAAGLLFPPNAAQALAERLLRVLENSDQAATMRQRGLEHARRFSWEKAGQQLAEVYRQVSQQ